MVEGPQSIKLNEVEYIMLGDEVVEADIYDGIVK